ncbi:TetR/AcrR family transcriptional regulator C-terminal domain-containing protein [Microbacterium sp. NPDC016588]|uniref:TetR/AcrR family tetracycline transcriptional repressor n=2 Tax=Microbacterium TaxID=33882 RepID=A0A7W7BN68_9MICO|nr:MULTISPECIES: TetR/AcrR family transcriptional regulator C-terminal domain-containing protein [Microbacterium]MBB4665730.1 TetR/AcrR family tetracycline transcriptional repressor [Microbacterium marinum]MDZ4233325.1 TetR/AcrR family transcriptional regulator C-terminal domain-containing protein [Dietzia sp.]HOQ52019.1 TetR/AcrR family transcriptional regulator C-terminal domain-containing protein [Micropruina sp.]AUG28043.1 transcriptional regulator [Microbacterium hominis]MBU21462.1 transc
MADRLSRRDVIHAALALLDRGGADAITLRGIARHLDVHLNSVSLQVGSKARLFDLMADAILGELSFDDLPHPPIDRVKEIFRRYRQVLLNHRDGAHLVSGTRVSETNTLRLGEAVIAALLDAGVDPDLAVTTFWSLNYLVVGLVHEEQTTPEDGAHRFEQELAAHSFPALTSVRDLFLDDNAAAHLEFGMDALLHRARHLD